jgi:hypothetical protein
MERTLNKFISNKHLIYIIQEYSREKNMPINEISSKLTKRVYLDTDFAWFYDSYFNVINEYRHVNFRAKYRRNKLENCWYINILTNRDNH